MPQIPNPYQALRLACETPEQQLVAHGTTLIATAPDEESKRRYVSALDMLTTHPDDRPYHLFWEPSGSGYQDAAEGEFLNRYANQTLEPETVTGRCREFLETDCSPGCLLTGLLPELSREEKGAAELDFGSAPLSPLRATVEPEDFLL